MLNELKKLPPLRATVETTNGRRNNRAVKRNVLTNSRQQVQNVNPRRRASNLIKDINNPITTNNNNDTSMSSQDDNDLNNPIATLMRIQQSSKHGEPIYTVVEERGQGRRKEYVMEVNCGGIKAHGTGNSKKHAKRISAKNMLEQMGYNTQSDISGSIESTINLSPNSADKIRKVTFSEPQIIRENVNQSVGTVIGRQLVPGIILMTSPENKSKQNIEFIIFV